MQVKNESIDIMKRGLNIRHISHLVGIQVTIVSTILKIRILVHCIAAILTEISVTSLVTKQIQDAN